MLKSAEAKELVGIKGIGGDRLSLRLNNDDENLIKTLSKINENITGGTKVKQGQVIGKTGNTGTRPSTLGTKKESHLHWELIMQKDKEEIFLGKGISNPELYEILSSIFYEPN